MAKTVYVRKSGLDANDGLTEATAKLTLAGANAIAVATDTVDIGAGTWTETLQIGKISNCLYRGSGIFITVIVGDMYRPVATSKLSDLKIAYTSAIPDTASTLLEWTRVFLDGSAVPTASARICQLGNGTYVLRNCIFFKCNSSGAGCFSITSSTANAKFYNCVFYKSPNSGDYFMYDYTSGGNTTVYFKNCIIVQPAGIFYGPNITHTYNCVYGSLVGWTLGPTEISSDPLFVDPEGGDFRLQAGSPCIGVGTGDLP